MSISKCAYCKPGKLCVKCAKLLKLLIEINRSIKEADERVRCQVSDPAIEEGEHDDLRHLRRASTET